MWSESQSLTAYQQYAAVWSPGVAVVSLLHCNQGFGICAHDKLLWVQKWVSGKNFLSVGLALFYFFHCHQIPLKTKMSNVLVRLSVLSDFLSVAAVPTTEKTPPRYIASYIKRVSEISLNGCSLYFLSRRQEFIRDCFQQQISPHLVL